MQVGGEDVKNILIENIKNIRQLSFDIPNPGLHILTGTSRNTENIFFIVLRQSRASTRNLRSGLSFYLA